MVVARKLVAVAMAVAVTVVVAVAAEVEVEVAALLAELVALWSMVVWS